MKYTIFTDLGHEMLCEPETYTLYETVIDTCVNGECSVEWAAKQLNILTEEVHKAVNDFNQMLKDIEINGTQWKEEAERKRFEDLLGDIKIDL